MTKIRARNEELDVKGGVITAVSNVCASSESSFPIYGGSAPGGVSGLGGGAVSHHAPPPPLDRQTSVKT